MHKSIYKAPPIPITHTSRNRRCGGGESQEHFVNLRNALVCSMFVMKMHGIRLRLCG